MEGGRHRLPSASFPPSSYLQSYPRESFWEARRIGRCHTLGNRAHAYEPRGPAAGQGQIAPGGPVLRSRGV